MILSDFGGGRKGVILGVWRGGSFLRVFEGFLMFLRVLKVFLSVLLVFDDDFEWFGGV